MATEIKIKESFEVISSLTKFSNVTVNISKYNIIGAIASIEKLEKGGLNVTIENVFIDLHDSLDLEIIKDGKIHYVYDLSIYKRSNQITRKDVNSPMNSNSGIIGCSSSLKVNVNGEFKNDDIVYYRFITPALGDRMLYHLETESYSNGDIKFKYGKINFSIETTNVTMYETRNEEKYYFIIDSTEPITLDNFSKICYTAMVGYGFVSACFHQDEAFYLASRKSDFTEIIGLQYRQLRPTISSFYHPIYSNPHGYTEDENLIKKTGTKVDVINSGIFSKLCSKINKDENYATLILLLLEANTASLLLKPAGYSVVLEKITNLIVEENKGLKPITNKDLSSKFKNELSNVLKKFSEEILDSGNREAVEILQKNIDKINNPTNRDKLLKPFKIHNISLSKYDIEAIEHRNNFLHGLKVNIEEKKSIETNYLDVFQISLRLNFLINRLILKHLGYKGWQVNHVKVNAKNFNFIIDEDVFIEI